VLTRINARRGQIDHNFFVAQLRQNTNTKEVVMTKTNVEVISRRRLFSVLGVAAAASVAAPMLTLSDAEAQTLGMERRHERRVGRHERRTDRREDRHDRRTDRRTGTTGAASTTGAAPAQK
jgi:hypothetical protein